MIQTIQKPDIFNESSFHPDHISDLRKSGLSDETIQVAGIKSLRPADIDRTIGYPTCAKSAYEIPYPGTDYSRFKMFYDEADKINPATGEERPKYLAKRDSGCRLYLPSKVVPVLGDLSVPIYLTEGEKKALKATQDGLYCIGMAGLWNWKVKDTDELISDFDLIALEGRTVYIVPDNDFLLPDRKGERKNLKQAVHKLAYKLIDKEAKVSWVELPSGDIKTGSDDYLCSHTVEDFKNLPVHQIRKLTIQEAINATSKETPIDDISDILKRVAQVKHQSEQSRYVNSISERTKISKRALQNDINDIREYSASENTHEGVSTITSANFSELIDLVSDNGKVAFLINNKNTLTVATAWDTSLYNYIPPDKQHLPFLLPRADEVVKWYNLGDDKNLFETVIAYLKRFSFLPDGQWLIVACNIFLSYIQDHHDVFYLPMLLFFAVPERGKSRTGKAVTYISYRGVHLCDMREANIFRFSENLRATLFFDIMDLWKKAEKSNSEDILLLRYEKGARAARVIYPEKGAFHDTVFYSIYGSTLIATNEAVHKILDSRCINITMPNKPGNYKNPTPELGLELKERLTAWRAKMMLESLPTLDSANGLSGRFGDITKPLLQVCKQVYPQGFEELRTALLEIAGTRIEDKKTSIEGQIVEAFCSLSPKNVGTWTITTKDLLGVLNKTRNEENRLKPQYLGRKLKALGIHTRHVHGCSESFLDISSFNILLAQYGFESFPVDMCKITLPNSTDSTWPTESRHSAGRIKVESGGNSTNSLPGERLENKGLVELVELGRVSGDINEEILEVEFVEEILHV